MMVGQKSKRGTAKKKAEEKQAEQPPNGQPNLQILTMEQMILRVLGNIERQQIVLGGKIDECWKKLNE